METKYDFAKKYREQILKCSRCGFCQSVCPAFGATLRPALNARGKMLLLKEIMDGEIDFSDELIETFFQWLLGSYWFEGLLFEWLPLVLVAMTFPGAWASEAGEDSSKDSPALRVEVLRKDEFKRDSSAEYSLDGDTGLLVPPEDDVAFADAVLRLLADPALRARLGVAAARRMRAHFAWPILVEAVEKAYR